MWLKIDGAIRTVAPGDTVAGLGRIAAIVARNDGWVVLDDKGAQLLSVTNGANGASLFTRKRSSINRPGQNAVTRCSADRFGRESDRCRQQKATRLGSSTTVFRPSASCLGFEIWRSQDCGIRRPSSHCPWQR